MCASSVLVPARVRTTTLADLKRSDFGGDDAAWHEHRRRRRAQQKAAQEQTRGPRVRDRSKRTRPAQERQRAEKRAQRAQKQLEERQKQLEERQKELEESVRVSPVLLLQLRAEYGAPPSATMLKRRFEEKRNLLAGAMDTSEVLQAKWAAGMQAAKAMKKFWKEETEKYRLAGRPIESLDDYDSRKALIEDRWVGGQPERRALREAWGSFY